MCEFASRAISAAAELGLSATTASGHCCGGREATPLGEKFKGMVLDYVDRDWRESQLRGLPSRTACTASVSNGSKATLVPAPPDQARAERSLPAAEIAPR